MPRGVYKRKSKKPQIITESPRHALVSLAEECVAAQENFDLASKAFCNAKARLRDAKDTMKAILTELDAV